MNRFLRDIAETYRAPRLVFSRLRAQSPQERQLLAWVMFACLISFLVRLPGLMAGFDSIATEQPIEAMVSANMVATLIFAPLFLYGLAAISHLIAKFLGGQGSWQSARLALFWTLISLQPIVILTVILNSLNLTTSTSNLIAVLSGGFFLWIWSIGLRECERAVA